MAVAGGRTSITAELLTEVSGGLRSDADQIHVHQVPTHPLAACRPWIVAGCEMWNLMGPIGHHSFWLPHGGQRIYSRAPASLPYCCGTPRGWLALTDDRRSPTRFILWEPLSKAEIVLPCLPAVAQVFLSGDPITSPDWMAIASQRTSYTGIAQKLFFWRPGDAAWTKQLEGASARIDSMTFHQGRFYFTEMAFSLRIYDLERPLPKLVRRIYLYPALAARHEFGRFTGSPAPYVVALNGDLLLVVMVRGRDAVVAAEVHRPDWAAERVELGEKTTDLGEYSLFLGRGDAFALSANEFPAIRRNCVYFVEHDTVKQWAVVFDLGSNALERIPHPEEQREDGIKINDWSAYSWICPRPVLESDPL